ncbi:MAG: hypothetical protein P0Y60_15805 [Candidatus Microbacterium colombiense]|nr:MAG: hypothetical protein P0Y60_15805 [Microbacterium sp.]
MPEEITVPIRSSSTGRSGLSRRAVVGAAVWSVPVLAVAVATPMHAASAAAIDASGVVLSFPDAGGSGSSELTLSGQLVLSSATTAPTAVTVTFTWQGTGANAASQGIWVYGGANEGILGWTFVLGAPDDGLYSTVVLQTSLATGTTQVPVVSRYDGDTARAILYGEETAVGPVTHYDGIYTIRFSAPGYADAVLTVPYNRPV